MILVQLQQQQPHELISSNNSVQDVLWFHICVLERADLKWS